MEINYGKANKFNGVESFAILPGPINEPNADFDTLRNEEKIITEENTCFIWCLLYLFCPMIYIYIYKDKELKRITVSLFEIFLVQ